MEENSTATRSYGTVYIPPDPSVKDISLCENITKVSRFWGGVRDGWSCQRVALSLVNFLTVSSTLAL